MSRRKANVISLSIFCVTVFGGAAMFESRTWLSAVGMPLLLGGMLFSAIFYYFTDQPRCVKCGKPVFDSCELRTSAKKRELCLSCLRNKDKPSP